MADHKDIRVLQWPREQLSVSHAYDGGKPLPLSVGFGASPLGVRVAAGDGKPFPVTLGMLLAAPRAIPLCLSLCESICMNSDYTIGITLFDKPIVTIRIQGKTRFSHEG